MKPRKQNSTLARRPRLTRALLAALCAVWLGAAAPAAAQVAPVDAVKPLRATRQALGVSYPEGVELTILMQGTQRLPEASGKGEVKRKEGVTRIETRIDNMKPATGFGGDFATYVVWTVSPEGHVNNAGEVLLDGTTGKAKVTTPLQTFGMFVTAEPHFLVDTPSEFVVLQTMAPKQEISGQMLRTSTIKYKGYDGIYEAGRETLNRAFEAKGLDRTDMKQARVSVDLAKRAGAEEYAQPELTEAEERLAKMVDAVEANVAGSQTMIMGHNVVRKAYEAQKLAEERSFQAALEAERAEHADEINTLEASIQAAQSEAERVRLIAERREMQLAMEQSAREQAAAEAAEAAARAEREREARLMAEQRASRASAEREAAQREATVARLEAQRAREEQDRIRERMERALSVVVETRETARGLIVNLPDILFDFGKATLRPTARETVAKVCGIMLVSPGYNLSVEGHTDSVGSDEFNQTLSEKRAKSVNDYLVECGLPGEEISNKGFGESNPIATNDTADGRQKNRRVEIVIEQQDDAVVDGLSKLQ